MSVEHGIRITMRYCGIFMKIGIAFNPSQLNCNLSKILSIIGKFEERNCLNSIPWHDLDKT